MGTSEPANSRSKLPEKCFWRDLRPCSWDFGRVERSFGQREKVVRHLGVILSDSAPLGPNLPLSACSDLSIASSPARIRKHHAEAVYSIEPRLDVRSRRVIVRINASMQRVRIVGMRPHGCMTASLTKEDRGLPGVSSGAVCLADIRATCDSVHFHRLG